MENTVLMAPGNILMKSLVRLVMAGAFFRMEERFITILFPAL